MKKPIIRFLLAVVLCFLWIPAGPAPAQELPLPSAGLLHEKYQVSRAQEDDELPELPVKGMVTLLDFGAKNCVPCKMLSPIIEKLKDEYQGKAAIYFVHVGKHKKLKAKHRIRVIPTLVFFDREGNEAYRHEGYLDKYFIEKRLRSMGVE